MLATAHTTCSLSATAEKLDNGAHGRLNCFARTIVLTTGPWPEVLERLSAWHSSASVSHSGGTLAQRTTLSSSLAGGGIH